MLTMLLGDCERVGNEAARLRFGVELALNISPVEDDLEMGAFSKLGNDFERRQTALVTFALVDRVSLAADEG